MKDIFLLGQCMELFVIVPGKHIYTIWMLWPPSTEKPVFKKIPVSTCGICPKKYSCHGGFSVTSCGPTIRSGLGFRVPMYGPSIFQGFNVCF